MEDTAASRVGSPYTVVRTIKETSVGPEEEPTVKIAALVQQRRRDDGKLSREFVSIRCDLGKKVMFFSVAAAKDLISGLTQVVPEADVEDARMRQEFESRRKRDQEDWEKRLSGEAGNGSRTHRTGKTERDKKKDSYKSPEKRKQEKSERDREIRSNMQKSTR